MEEPGSAPAPAADRVPAPPKSIPGNLTEGEKLVRRLLEPAPHPDHYLLVFKRTGKEWKLRLAVGPGEVYKKPFFESPDSLVAYIVPSDRHLRYRPEPRTFRTHDQLHSFTLQLTLEYRVSDPASLIQKLEQDPLRRVVEELDSILQQRIKSLGWAAVEFEQIDLEHVLFHSQDFAAGDASVSGFAKLSRFAAERGLGIQRIAVVRELPDQEIDVPANRLRNARAQEKAGSDHGTNSLNLTHALDLDGQKKAFDRHHLVADGISNNIVTAFNQATDNIRSLDDIARAVPKVAAIQGAVASVAMGLPGAAPPTLAGVAGPVLLGARAATPLSGLLAEIGLLESLVCDPAQRQEVLSLALHLIAEALRGPQADAAAMTCHAERLQEAFEFLISASGLSPAQAKFLRRLQNARTLIVELG